MWSSTVLGNFFIFHKILRLWVIVVYVTLKKIASGFVINTVCEFNQFMKST